jgi:23S rRNA (adenine2503-C2)-methyltransferase
LQALFADLKQPAFRIKQTMKAIYDQTIFDFSEITTLSMELREILENRVTLSTVYQLSVQQSKKDNTVKFLFETFDQKKIEAVLMRHLKGRNTLCISTQVGCAMSCKFCATGKLGFTRNLTYSEIIDQVLEVNRFLKEFDQKVTNIVFMGMGEPFLNMENLFPALETLCNENRLNLSSRHVTISTCGIIPGIKKLLNFPYQVNLAISIHSADDKVRNDLMPINKRYPLEKLMLALDEYTNSTNRRVFYEYILIDGITDTVNMAKKLGHLLRDRLSHVNLIPYNPVHNNDKFKPSERLNITIFKEILESYGVTNSLRYTLGNDIDAACGQLAAKAN